MASDRDRARAVNLLAATVPRVQREIWVDAETHVISYGLLNDSSASAGERLIASLCISLWNGSVPVSLTDVIGLDDMRYGVLLKAMAIARGD